MATATNTSRRYRLSAGGGTTLTSGIIRFVFISGRSANQPSHTAHPPTFYLERFSGPREPVQFSRNGDGDATVLEVPDLSFMGRGSVTMDLLVENRDEEPFELRMDAEVTLDGGRLSTDYELTGTATTEIPAWVQ